MRTGMILSLAGLIFISRTRSWVAYPFFVLYAFFVSAAVYGTLLWLMWMFVFISFDPIGVSTLLIAAVSSVIFVVSSGRAIRSILNAPEIPLAFKRFSADLTKQDLVVYIYSVTVLSLSAVGVVLFGWILLTPESQRTVENVSSFVVMGAVPGFQYFSSVRVKSFVTGASDKIAADHAAETAA
ncbi:hypothetical protein T492DRAFT_1101177 [Pavlovales sp. CCMP2436]|nr:hypothetical protein T492DRAFT_1101177 [Pavlovales sp. CCMP2436]